VRSRIDELAAHLLREGHVDNEADARLAAVHILLASGEHNGDVSGDGDDAAQAQ
jgi:hypothetical protein